MSLPTAHAAIPRLAVSMLSETPNESGEVCEMRGLDLDGHRQMLQAECLRGPGWLPAEDLSNASFLGTGKHRRYVRAGSGGGALG
jgi:hypothetical protein